MPSIHSPGSGAGSGGRGSVTPSAAQVCGPQMPSTSSPLLRWNSLSKDSVVLPKSPSIHFGISDAIYATLGPVLPFLTIGSASGPGSDSGPGGMGSLAGQT